MSNQELNRLLIYGLGALIVCVILYLLRWYIFGALVCWGVFKLYHHLKRT